MTKLKNLRYYTLVAIFLISYLVLLNSNLPIVSLDYYKPRPSFWDLDNGMLHLWECYGKVGLDLFSYQYLTFPNLDQCHNFNYGYFSIVSFGLTHLLLNNVLFWGYTQILVFVLLSIKLNLFVKTKRIIAINLLAAFSPGVFLLFISGNLDIQIICLLLISTLLIISKREKVALSLIFITALFKFYTAPVLVLALFLVKREKSRVFCLGLIAAMSVAIAYQMVTNPLPPFPDGAQNKFGSGIFDNYLRKVGVGVPDLAGEILGIVLLTMCILTIVYCHKKFGKTRDLQADFSKKEELLYVNFLIMATTSICCYLAALNVDYRLTFVALAGVALLQIPHVKVKFISAIFPYVWLLSLWIVFPFASLDNYIGIDIQPIGDLLMIGTISYFMFQGFFVFNLITGWKFLSYKSRSS